MGPNMRDFPGCVGGDGMFVEFVIVLMVPLLVFIALYVRYVKRHSRINKNVTKRKRSLTSIRLCCVAGSGMVRSKLFVY